MKLYTDYKAPNPRRLSYFLRYKGIELETEIISLNDKANLSDDFTKVNPLQTLPTLQLDDGNILTDTVAICLYLELLYPDKPLFGDSKQSMAQVVGWCHRIFCYGLDAVAEIFRNSTPFFADRAMPIKPPLAQNPDLIARGTLRLNDFFQEMNDHLSGREFIVGDRITQADIDCYLIPSFAKWVKITVPEEIEAFHAWHNRMSDIIKSLES